MYDCPDHEDNLILDLAAEVGALIVVSADTDLLPMSPWRETPLIEPRAFAAKVDAMRRHAKAFAPLALWVSLGGNRLCRIDLSPAAS